MSIDAKWEKLVAMMERLTQPPTVNVNISLDGAALRAAADRKKKPLESPETQQPDFQPGGYPRPFVT